MRIKRYIVGLSLMLLIATTAHAFLPVAGLIAWLGTDVAGAVATRIAVSVAINVGVIKAFFISMEAKNASGGASGSPTLTVYLNPSAARANPDPSKFDDPAPGARDVTPKAKTTGSRTSTNTPAGLAPPTTLYYLGNTYATSAAAACNGYPPTTGGLGDGGTAKYYYAWADGACRSMQLNTGKDGAQYGPFVGTATNVGVTSSNTSVCPGTNLTATAGKCPASNFPETGPVTCPTGYTAGSSGTDCNLSDPGAVKKPDTQPCELLRTASGLEQDPKNPNCLLPEIQVQGNSTQVDSQSISINADGSVSVATPTGQTTFQIGAYNNDGSVDITGISRTGNPGSFDATVPPGGGTSGGGGNSGGGGGTGTTPSCGGINQPACSSGNDNGGGSCGGPGQPACTIDDSGFAGKSVSTAAGEAALDDYGAQKGNLLDTLKNSVATPDFGWQLPVQSIACQPLEFGFFKGMHFRLNWCPYIGLMHQAISFLAYCFTALYLFSLLYSNRSEAK